MYSTGLPTANLIKEVTIFDCAHNMITDLLGKMAKDSIDPRDMGTGIGLVPI